MFTIKRSSKDDGEFLSLVRQLDAELSGRYGEEQSKFDPYNILDETAHILLVYSEQEPVGCGCFRPYPGVAGAVEIKRMYVKRAMRGKGIAGIILKELEAWAAALGYTKALLETGTKQPEAVASYTRAGYTVTENYGPYKNSSYSICMSKVLKGSSV
jgi:GNAT superfamily N-acetyltransferase